MERLNLEEKEQIYNEVLKNLNDAEQKRFNFKGGITLEWLQICNDCEKYKKELTKARKEFAIAIMTNFEEVENNLYEEKIENKKERYQELADKNREQSNTILQNTNDMADVIPFGQPILFGHHSEKGTERFATELATVLIKVLI